MVQDLVSASSGTDGDPLFGRSLKWGGGGGGQGRQCVVGVMKGDDFFPGQERQLCIDESTLLFELGQRVVVVNDFNFYDNSSKVKGIIVGLGGGSTL